MLDPSQFQGKLASSVERFADQILKEVTRKAESGGDIAAWIDMLRASPILGSAYESVVLLALANFELAEINGNQDIKFTHPSEEIQGWVGDQFAGMRGTLSQSVAELLSAIAFGDAFSEVSQVDREGEWGLESIALVDPRRWNFEGRAGQYENVRYRSLSGKDIRIPYAKGIHVRNQAHLRLGDTYSPANAQRAYPAYQAWLIITSEAVIAGERQATPLLAGYAPSDSQVPLLDSNGNQLRDRNNNPINVSAPQALGEALANIENQSVIATDIANRIEAISQTVDAGLFKFLLKYFERMQLQAFLVPETAFAVGEGGLGNAGLVESHLGLLKQSVEQMVNQIKGALIEQVVRPLIVWNFGEQSEGYGSFPSPEKSQIDVTIAQTISNGLATGTFSSADLEVINRMRETLGIAPARETLAGLAQMAHSVSADYWRLEA